MRAGLAQEQETASTDGFSRDISNASVYRAADLLIERHKSGMPVSIEAFDVPHAALIRVAEQLEEIGISYAIAENFVEALKDYIVRKGGDFARVANAKPIYISAEVAAQKPAFRFEDGVTELAAIDGTSAKVQGIGQVEVQATISGTSMTSNRANIDKIFESVRGMKLWVRFEAPTKKELEGLLAQQDLGMLSLAQAVGASAPATDVAAAIAQTAAKGRELPPAVLEVIQKLVQLKAAVETIQPPQASAAKAESVKAEPAKAESFKAEAAKVEAAKAEPAKVETQQGKSSSSSSSSGAMATKPDATMIGPIGASGVSDASGGGGAAVRKVEILAREIATAIEPVLSQIDASPVVVKAILQATMQISSPHMAQSSPVMAQVQNVLRQASMQGGVQMLSSVAARANSPAITVAVNNLIADISSGSATNLARHAPEIRQILSQSNVSPTLKSNIVEAVRHVAHAAPAKQGVSPVAMVAAVTEVLKGTPAAAASIIRTMPAVKAPVSVSQQVVPAARAAAAQQNIQAPAKTAAAPAAVKQVVTKPVVIAPQVKQAIVAPKVQPVTQPIAKPAVFTNTEKLKASPQTVKTTLRERTAEKIGQKFMVQGKATPVQTTTAAHSNTVEVEPARSEQKSAAPAQKVEHKNPAAHPVETYVAPVIKFAESFTEMAKKLLPQGKPSQPEMPVMGEVIKYSSATSGGSVAPVSEAVKSPVLDRGIDIQGPGGRNSSYTAEAPNVLSKAFNDACSGCKTRNCAECPMKMKGADDLFRKAMTKLNAA